MPTLIKLFGAPRPRTTSGTVVDSVVETTGRMAAAGHPAIASGHSFAADGDGVFAYYDTAVALGFVVEAVEPPISMPEPSSRSNQEGKAWH